MLNAIPTPSAYVIARTDGKSVGCARAVVSGSIMGLFDLLVDPKHRGQGFGRGLLEARLNWGFEQGARLAYLQVMANNASMVLASRTGIGIECSPSLIWRTETVEVSASHKTSVPGIRNSNTNHNR